MSSNYINEFTGKVIRDIRLSKNLTLSELARRVKISYQQLQKYEKGTNRLSIDKLYEISKLLNVDICDFFPNPTNRRAGGDIQAMLVGDAFLAINDKEMKEIIMKLMNKLSMPPQIIA